MKSKNTKSKKICNCGCPKSLKLKAKLRKQKQKNKQSRKYQKITKNNKKQNFHTKKSKYSNKKTSNKGQKGGSDCRIGLMTEIGFKIPENNGIKGLTIPNGKALITNKPGCITSNIHP